MVRINIFQVSNVVFKFVNKIKVFITLFIVKSAYCL